MAWISLVTTAILFSAVLCGDVIELTDANFESETVNHAVALIKFYAPWCGHCKKLAPDYDKAATKLKQNDPPVPLIKVDCTVEKATCDKHGVSGFPTLKVFRHGKPAQDYDGPRDSEGIVKYMRGQAGPSAKEIKSAEELRKFLEYDDLAIVGYFEQESKLKDSFHKVADIERDRFRFAYVTNADVFKSSGYSDDIVAHVPAKLHNKFEDNEIKYDGNYDTDKIKHFLTHETTGLAGIRTAGNLFQFQRRPMVIVYCNIDYVKDPKGSNYWRNRVLTVAKLYKRKVHFAISSREEFASEIEQYGLGNRKDTEKPLVAALTDEGKFHMEQEFNIENLNRFVDDLIKGKLEPYVKSEPVPEEQGNVKVVVAKNFKEIVTDADKDVLIEFYAPWCGHCKALAPKYDELGEKMKNEEVVIAKMDATANDVPPKFEVRGFPTLFWIPKNAKDSPVQYQGGRDVKDFVKYIAEHSTDGLKGYTRSGKKKIEEL